MPHAANGDKGLSSTLVNGEPLIVSLHELLICCQKERPSITESVENEELSAGSSRSRSALMTISGMKETRGMDVNGTRLS